MGAAGRSYLSTLGSSKSIVYILAALARDGLRCYAHKYPAARGGHVSQGFVYGLASVLVSSQGSDMWVYSVAA